MKRLFALTLFIFSLAGCSEDFSTIDGMVLGVDGDSLTVDCSGEVNENDPSPEDIGYTCTIFILEDTLIVDESGSRLFWDDLSIRDSVTVHLKESSVITTDKDTRELEAIEVIRYKEE